MQVFLHRLLQLKLLFSRNKRKDRSREITSATYVSFWWQGSSLDFWVLGQVWTRLLRVESVATDWVRWSNVARLIHHHHQTWNPSRLLTAASRLQWKNSLYCHWQSPHGQQFEVLGITSAVAKWKLHKNLGPGNCWIVRYDIIQFVP